MERYKQESQIRTNIVFEFNAVGAQACNELKAKILHDIAELRENNLTVSLVGLNLRKPTANFSIISKDLSVEEKSNLVGVEDLVKAKYGDENEMKIEDLDLNVTEDDEETESEEEEEIQDDKESD